MDKLIKMESAAPKGDIPTSGACQLYHMADGGQDDNGEFSKAGESAIVGNSNKQGKKRKKGNKQKAEILAQNDLTPNSTEKVPSEATPNQDATQEKTGKNTISSKQKEKDIKAKRLAQMMDIYAQRKALLEQQEREMQEQLRKEKEEEERLESERIEKEKVAQAKREQKKKRMEAMKKEGVFVSPAKKKAEAKNREKLAAMLNSGNFYNISTPKEGSNVQKRGKKSISNSESVKRTEKSPSRTTKAVPAEGNEGLNPKNEAEPTPASQKPDVSPSQPTYKELSTCGKIDESVFSPRVGQMYILTAEASSEEEDVPEDWADVVSDDESPDKKKSIAKKVKPNAPSYKSKYPAEMQPPVPEQAPAIGKSFDVKGEKSPDVKQEKCLRSPICCILGHVDSGKTKLLDKIRQSNVQGGEAGGITQQIGATFFPMGEIINKVKCLYTKAKSPNYLLPGLLVIDTPGHESFTNLRQRGSSMCNIAILVINILSGIEKQTYESIKILKRSKTPFIVALNKIDRLYGWKSTESGSSKTGLAKQLQNVKMEFKDRLDKVMLQLSEEGLNSALCWENKNTSKYVSIVPVSALTGEGIPDLLDLLVQLTQSKMASTLTYKDEVNCTVLEVKVVEGLGTVVDVILSSGELEENQKIALYGMSGAIKTTIRSILTPQPMAELRVKCPFIAHKKIKAALGARIVAPNMEKAVAGSRVIVLKDSDDESAISGLISDFDNLLKNISTDKRGVCVQASSLGSLEALIAFLKASDVPIIGINIGPVRKKDVIRASTTLESAPEYAQILAFDVPIDKDAQLLANELNVKISKQNVIYHLFDEFTKYIEDIKKKKQDEMKHEFVYPCIVEVVPGCVFNKVNPIIIGVSCIEGTLKLETPLCVMDDPRNPVPIGRVTGIESNHVAKTEASQGGPSVSIKIESPHSGPARVFGRHLNEKSLICSHITPEAVSLFNGVYKDKLKKSDEPLLLKLKKLFGI